MKMHNEDNLIEALKLRDSGKSLEDILRAYPTAETEIKELFETIEVLENVKDAIRPSTEVLQSALRQIPASPVTNPTDIRYSRNRREEVKGRFPSINIQDQIRNILSTMNTRILIPMAVVAVVVIAFGYYLLSPQAPQYSNQQNPATQNAPATNGAPATTESVNPAPSVVATGNPDDTVNDLLKSFAGEQVAINADTNSDVSSATADSQDLSDLGQSYDEAQF